MSRPVDSDRRSGVLSLTKPPGLELRSSRDALHIAQAKLSDWAGHRIAACVALAPGIERVSVTEDDAYRCVELYHPRSTSTFVLHCLISWHGDPEKNLAALEDTVQNVAFFIRRIPQQQGSFWEMVTGRATALPDTLPLDLATSIHEVDTARWLSDEDWEAFESGPPSDWESRGHPAPKAS